MRTALLTLSVCVLALPANAQYSGGSGTADDPYQIATAAASTFGYTSDPALPYSLSDVLPVECGALTRSSDSSFKAVSII